MLYDKLKTAQQRFISHHLDHEDQDHGQDYIIGGIMQRRPCIYALAAAFLTLFLLDALHALSLIRIEDITISAASSAPNAHTLTLQFIIRLR